MRFEWDEEKAAENLKKHRVSFEQAQGLFDDPQAVPFEDVEHSTVNETRYAMVGMSSIGLLCISFTYREDTIRLISARRAEKWMVRIYEDKK